MQAGNNNTGKQVLAFIATVALSTTGYYFSTGIYPYWLLTWLAPIPLFIYALRSSALRVLLAGYITYFGGFSSGIWIYRQTTTIPVATLIMGNLITAAGFTLLLLLFCRLAIKQKHWGWSFVFASGWTALEFITSLLSPAGTIDSIAYSQIYNLPVIQIASVTGILGITFLVVLIPSGIALAWHYRENRRLALIAAGFPLVFLILTVVFGLYRLHTPPTGPSLKIGMAAVPLSINELLSRGQRQQIQSVTERYIRDIEQLAAAGAEVIVLPEKTVEINLKNQGAVLERLAAAAKQEGVSLIVGVSIKDNGSVYNSAYLFPANEQAAQRYDKQHLLQVIEGQYTAGTQLVTVEGKGLWGFAVCKDMDFEEPARGYGQLGTGLLLVPALDFKADALLHGRVAIMRGVEHNFAVARAAQWGLLTLSNNRGQIVQSASVGTGRDDTLLVGEIRLEPGGSIFSRWGNWFGYFCGGLFTVLIAYFLSLRKKEPEE